MLPTFRSTFQPGDMMFTAPGGCWIVWRGESRWHVDAAGVWRPFDSAEEFNADLHERGLAR